MMYMLKYLKGQFSDPSHQRNFKFIDELYSRHNLVTHLDGYHQDSHFILRSMINLYT